MARSFGCWWRQSQCNPSAIFAEKEIDYYYIDVDPAAVDGSRKLAAAWDFAPPVLTGFNDKLDFADCAFDAVFSSHCVEHSFQP